MANGTFSKTRLSMSASYTDLHGVPNTVEFQTLTVSVFNNSANRINVTLAAAVSTPGVADIFAKPAIEPYGTYDYSCRVFGPGEHIFASCTDSGDANVHIFGITKGM